MNRKANRINDLPTPPPRQCWVCVPPVIALKTRGPQLAQPGGVFANLAGLAQDQAGLTRGVEHPLILGQHHGAGAFSLGVTAQQGAGLQIKDLDALGE